MKSNIFKQLCGKINYNTYCNIENLLLYSGLGLALTDDLILSQYPMLSSPINTLLYTTLIANLAMTLSHGEIYTRDVTQIRDLYGEFIKNYNKLNKIFNLNDPIEIYTMFNYLLYKGYLSKNKEFEFSDKLARDILGLFGVNIITGHGVCRHISGALTDVLNDYGIESYQLGGYSTDYSINIEILKEPKYTKEELVNWVRGHIIDEKTHESLIMLIEKLVDEYKQNIEISSEPEDIKNPLIRMIGNHAITYACNDEKNYFLDPTQKRVYRLSKTNVLYDAEGELPIRLTSSIVLNRKKYIKMRKKLSQHYLDVSKEEEREIYYQTLDICNRNMDIFDQFYNENSELYDDITDKVLKIRKNRFIK